MAKNPEKEPLTPYGAQVKHAYLEERKRHTGASRALSSRYNNPDIWNKAGAMVESMGAPCVDFVRRLVEISRGSQFPWPTVMSSSYAAKLYLKTLGLEATLDDEGCVVPLERPRVMDGVNKALTGSSDANEDKRDAPCPLPRRIANCLWEVRTAVYNRLGHTDFSKDETAGLVCRDFFPIPLHGVFILGWRNPKIRRHTLTAAREFFKNNPEWLPYLASESPEAAKEVNALKLLL